MVCGSVSLTNVLPGVTLGASVGTSAWPIVVACSKNRSRHGHTIGLWMASPSQAVLKLDRVLDRESGAELLCRVGLVLEGDDIGTVEVDLRHVERLDNHGIDALRIGAAGRSASTSP